MTTLIDFERRPLPTGLLVVWLRHSGFKTALFEFDVKLQTSIGEPEPNEEMFRLVDDLAAFTAKNVTELASLLQASHLTYDPAAGERRTKIALPDLHLHLRSKPWVMVKKSSKLRPNIIQIVHFSPSWDPEHALDIEIRGGRMFSANYSADELRRLKDEARNTQRSR